MPRLGGRASPAGFDDGSFVWSASNLIFSLEKLGVVAALEP
jgi:hypothetical protein